MSGFGGFGGFGSQNTQNTQNSSFGGFGSGTNSGGGFGSGNTSSPFGQKSGFGTSTTAATSSGLFGGGTATSGTTGFGGFGSGTSGFGSGASAGLFGNQNKTAGFGTTGSAGGLFSGGGASAGFGSGATGFGASSGAGFGANAAQQNNGTGATPFSPFIDKDTGTTQTSHYQSITFMQPYQHFSFEELRHADYNQGRKYGNASGQAGAFGTSTGFGGFGANTSSSGFGSGTAGGGLFGASNTTPGFGQQNATSGFGSGASAAAGSLFGQTKPSGGLFGGATATSGQQSGGLFGTSGASGFGSGGGGGGFGSGAAGGGLFGQQGQQSQQNKPAFGGFGSGTTGGFGGSGTTGFGQNTSTSTGTGLFGSSTSTSGPFGQQQNAAASSFGGFGQNQQSQQQTQSSGLFGGFGQNQNKPGGLFGNTGATGSTGLFGNQTANQPAQAPGLFGNAQNQQPSGGLFGNKPAPTGTGLFGNPQTQQTGTTGGLFGNLGGNQHQQNQGTNLFGQQNQTKPLFGASTTANAAGGTGLFGNLGQSTTTPALNNSLFGSGQQQQQATLGSSIFGTSQATQPAQNPPNLTTSINANPYGNDQLFMSLSTASPSAGPLATPLSGSQKLKKSAILPQYKINPAASSRLITPQKRTQGYGFSYSTYGSPGSASSNVSPSFSGSLLGSGSFGRSLGKSFSTSNLRQSWNADDSILAPGAFTASGLRNNATGSLKRLTVNRNLNIRPSLFGDSATSPNARLIAAASPPSTKKTVSFDTSVNGADEVANGVSSNAAEASMAGALVRTETDNATPTPEEQGLLRSKKPVNGAATNGAPAQPEMEEASGKELVIVADDDASQSQKDLARQKARSTQTDQKPGAYWMKPSLKELQAMNPQQLKHLPELIVGREGIGQITFHTPDMSDIPLERIFGEIVCLEVRSATAYGDHCPIAKPAPGNGLNVPSTITLENSWPRAQRGKPAATDKNSSRVQKHIERLKRVADTEFISYSAEQGAWTFKVYHYTTYGLDYEGEPQHDAMLESSMLGLAPESPTPMKRTPRVQNGDITYSSQMDVSMMSPPDSGVDDTFEFKKGKRKAVPGRFEDEDISEYDDEMEGEDDTLNTQSFLDERSVGSADDDVEEMEDITEEEESDLDDGQDMAGTFPSPGHTTELTAAKQSSFDASSVKPKSILKTSQMRRSILGTPPKARVIMDTNWTEQLQRTVSPKKKDRQALRESQATVAKGKADDNNSASNIFGNGKAFTTSIDLMNSLFGKDTGKRSVYAAKTKTQADGFKWPYQKRSKIGDDASSMKAEDKAFHQSFKPSWTYSTLVYSIPGNAPPLQNGVIADTKAAFVSEHNDIRFARLIIPRDVSPETLIEQKKVTTVSLDHNSIPYAFIDGEQFTFERFAQAVSIHAPSGLHEQRVWQLAGILFDDLEYPDGVPNDGTYADQHRKELLTEFWKKLVVFDADRHIQRAQSQEEKALAYLSANNLWEACAALALGGDFRLGTLVAQIGGSQAMRTELSKQIASWRQLNVLSEMEEPIRALYELLAGNCSVCEGKASIGQENKASTFRISSRFGLDWRRAFGLRLWYGILANEPLEVAVEQFTDDLESGTEDVKPLPWFIEKKVDMGWTDPNPETREDLLWGLLKLYAAQKRSVKMDVAEILAPQNVSGNPFNPRLSFQLIHLFRSRGLDLNLRSADEERPDVADSLSTVYSSSLLQSPSDSSTKDPSNIPWSTALWVNTHLSNGTAREKAIRDILEHQAPILGDPETDPVFSYLTNDLKIPTSWIWSAKAQHARSVLNDRPLEVRCLLEAGEHAAAHEVFCRYVAPGAVVSGNLDELRELLGGFEEIEQLLWKSTSNAVSGGHRPEILPGWNVGGGLYYDFIHLLDLHRGGSFMKDQRWSVIRRLTDALKALENARRSGRKPELVERVALNEMAQVVADVLARDFDDKPDRSSTLKLPLAEDGHLKQTRELSLKYYRTLLIGGS